MNCASSSIASFDIGRREPPAGTQRSGPPEPSAPSSKPAMPPAATGCTTAAPAPSPKRMHVERSCQFVIFESVSAPITSARVESPVATWP